MQNILAAEILAHTIVAPALSVGALAVFTDFKGREVGCSVVRMFAAGEISTTAQIEIRCCGLSVPAPYAIGSQFVVDASKVKGAI